MVRDRVDGLGGVPPAFHFEAALGDGERVGVAPVAGGVDPEAFGAAHLDDVGRPLGGAFGVRVERHAGPEALAEHEVDGVFFDMVDQDSAGIDGAVAFDRVDDELGALEFVFEVGRVDEDELVVLGGEGDLFFEDGEFVLGVYWLM